VIRGRWVLPSALIIMPNLSGAALNGESIVSGQATFFRPDANTTIITQLSDKLIINFDSFSIGLNETVQFVQPSSSSFALNRVTGGSSSSILGQLSANGNIFLVNSAGVFFAPSAKIDVSGIIATTLDIVNQDFLQNNFEFTKVNGSGFGKVINEGEIKVLDGGFVVLAGDYSENSGLIQAKLGTVALASGSRVSLDLSGDGLIQFAVDQASVDALAGVNNLGQITANGGQVIMTAKVANDLASTVVQNSGTISAESIVEHEGNIFLSGSGGDVINTGALSVASLTEANGGSITVQSDSTTLIQENSVLTADSTNGTGGNIKILGERVGLFDQASLAASGATGGGEILIGGDRAGLNANVQNAKRTAITSEVSITADATDSGNGGKVIVWADENTHFEGNISAKGGDNAGDGGFVEVSGKENLFFDGVVDTSSLTGEVGTLLLDPRDIIISNGAAGADDAQVTGDNTSLFGDVDTVTDFTIAEQTLEGLTGTVILQADRDIIFQDLADNNLNLYGGFLVFQAGEDITFNDVNDVVTTAGSSIHFEADSPHAPTLGGDNIGTLSIGSINTGSGGVTLLGQDINLTGGTITGNGITIGEANTAGTDGQNTGAVLDTANQITFNNATGAFPKSRQDIL